MSKDKEPIDPNYLALMTPRFRPVILAMLDLPVDERAAAFKAWCESQPDGKEIMAAVAAIDPFSPPPINRG